MVVEEGRLGNTVAKAWISPEGRRYMSVVDSREKAVGRAVRTSNRLLYV